MPLSTRRRTTLTSAFAALVLALCAALIPLTSAADASVAQHAQRGVQPYINGTTNRFYCTFGAPAAPCAPAASWTKYRYVQMYCWKDTTTYKAKYSSARWFYVRDGNTFGWIHSSRVSDQATVPHCSSYPGIVAAEYAAMGHGSTAPTAEQAVGDYWPDRFSGNSYLYCYDALRLTGPTPRFFDSSDRAARAAMDYYVSAGKATFTFGNTTPIGSMVFFSLYNGGRGLCGIYVGNGRIMTSLGSRSNFNQVRRYTVTVSSFGGMSGVVFPENTL